MIITKVDIKEMITTKYGIHPDNILIEAVAVFRKVVVYIKGISTIGQIEVDRFLRQELPAGVVVDVKRDWPLNMPLPPRKCGKMAAVRRPPIWDVSDDGED